MIQYIYYLTYKGENTVKPFSYHVHTQFCDGRSTAEEMVLSAIENGFDSLGFSSHGHVQDQPGCNRDYLSRADGNILYTDESKSKVRLYGFVPKGSELFGMTSESIEPYGTFAMV